ncbi:MAG: amino acid-binding protein [Mycobacteriales bacterium]
MHLRVDLPDRPGVLARLADALARSGADVLSVTVTERTPGRAVDDFLLDWPASKSTNELTAAIDGVGGCRPLGIRRVATVPDENPALDLVTHVLWQPHRAVETLVDMLPSFAGADWAAAVSDEGGRRCLYPSAAAPARLPDRPAASSTRALAYDDANTVGVTVPLAGTDVLIMTGRADGPVFSRREIDELVRLTDLLVTLVRAVVPHSATPPSRLTARLLHVSQV